MKLSLSVRVAESFSDKRKSTMTIDELIAMAMDVEEMFAGLHQVGYQGYVTVHQAFGGVVPVEEAVRRSHKYLEPFTEVAPV